LHLAPTPVDLWLARELATLARLHVPFNVGVQASIRSDILGGLWYGLALFVFWVRSARNGQRRIQLRVLTILLGSTLAILLTVLLQTVVTWPPPVHYPGLERLYYGLLEPNPNTNSFPSQSVALYASVAAGVYSLQKAVGWALWILVVVFVAIPRMFVAGHFLTDVLVGFVVALVGYWLARHLLEARLTTRLQVFFDETPRRQLFMEILVFIWILQVSVEFQGAVWFKTVGESIMR
jgi:membrane-associated phospholipid phosphatase